MENLRLAPSELRWHCDESVLDFETTDSLDPSTVIVGQDTAREALLFGMLCNAPGQNVFVRGVPGTGRLTIVQEMLAELKPSTDCKRDYCYVHNFGAPERPRLIVLPAGRARAFQRRIGELARFVKENLIKALESEPFASQRQRLKETVKQKIAGISGPLEKDLAENRMAMVTVQQGPMTAPVIFPLVDGKPVQPDQLAELVAEGKADEQQLEEFRERYPEFQQRLQEVAKQANAAFREGSQEVEKFNEQAARSLFSGLTGPLLAEFGESHGVGEFVDDLVSDAVENRLVEPDEDAGFDLAELYGVNIVLTQVHSDRRPVIQESTPSVMNLLGTVEPKPAPGGMAVSDFRGIRPGALLKADQGFLILDAEDLVNEPGAWHSLKRTLRTGRLEIVPPESGWMRPYAVIQPEPIEIHVRVILIGDVSTWHRLDLVDPDFRELFKVLADFDDQLPRDDHGIRQYATVITRLAREENLPGFSRSAVAALVEHGSRIASRNDKLTARFGRIADLAREAAFLAVQGQPGQPVERDHVIEAVDRTKRRASLPSRKFKELVDNGTIIVRTSGQVVGQINGLAVMKAGQLTYGFPARITAAIGPGRAGLINIEGSARMSGAIHTKGFHILGGLLMNLLRLPHPLAFSASIAFEQSYGGIDGDSASGAEMVCLLSALTGIPVRQGMSMTGAIDQHGHIEAIGGVNEKIEGFYDACFQRGLTGDQGVVIPRWA